MKKLFVAAVCAVFALTASAQRASSTSSSFFSTEKADEGVRFGVRAGLNFANLSGDHLDLDSRTSFHVGVIADIPLMQSLYIQTGLYFQSKGAKSEFDMDYNGYDVKVEQTYSPMYLSIPVLASYRYNFSDALQLQVNFGPYFAYGIAGKYKVEASAAGESADEDYKLFDSDEGDWNAFDCGLQVGAGLTFAKHYYLGFTYDFGLTEVADGDDAPTNSNWMISLGYNF